jgi:hypothetical protein
MAFNSKKLLRIAQEDFGIGVGVPGLQALDMADSKPAMDAKNRLLAMDAAPTNALQPQSILISNGGIPAFLTNYIWPEVVRVLTSPMVFAQILGEKKVGDWTMRSTQFPVVESTGQVSSYGDKSNSGRAGALVNWEPRQSYGYQIFTEWGDQELDRMGLAKIDWAAEQNVASALVMQKFENYTYAFGVQGLDNYGLLNDPSLTAPISPNYAWNNSSATGLTIFNDIQRMYYQLQGQLNGNLSMGDDLILAMSPLSEAFLLSPTSNIYGNANVIDLLKKSFPRLTVMTAPEYATASGNLVQLILRKVSGRDVGFMAFTEKMRAHAIVRETSSVHQKKSGGTWGAVIMYPAAISQMLGV